jgi:hypothetical protein
MSALRALIFFVAYVAMMVATFGDADALLSRWRLQLFLFVPLAIIAIAVLGHGRVLPRLPESIGWYVALLALTIADFSTIVIASPWLAFVTPALMLAVGLTLLHVKPRIGDLYQGQTMPGFTAFLALTALISLSITPLKDLAAVGVSHPAIDRIPWPMTNLAAAAVLAILFILVTGIRQRSMQPNPAKAWLVPGIVVFIVAAAAHHSKAMVDYARYALLAGHLLLFIGVTYLLGHLLPSRASDHMA